MTFDDLSHRYAPETVVCRGFIVKAVSWTAHSPGQHDASPIKNDLWAVEIKTSRGSRWFGCSRAYINSELRMVVVGHDSRDEVRQKWPIYRITD